MGVAAVKKGYADSGPVSSLGTDIRALRKSRSMTLVDFAANLGRSIGFVSQIERGLSEPTMGDLRNIASLFNVPISFFFGRSDGDQSEQHHVVRADGRRRIGSTAGDLFEELLSPDLSGSFEIIRSEFAPESALREPLQRDTEEAGFLVSGTFEIEIGGAWHRLQEGDAFRLRAEPYRWRNPGTEPAVVIWVISPPVY